MKLKNIQCVSKRMELSETGFYEPYRALLKLTTQLDGLSYYTRVWQGTIGTIFGVPTVPYSALQSLYLGQYKLLILYPRNLIKFFAFWQNFACSWNSSLFFREPWCYEVVNDFVRYKINKWGRLTWFQVKLNKK